MPEESRKSKWIYVRWFAIRFFLVVYDIIAVNAACYLALLTRFYVAKQFHSAAAQYIEAYTSYAPYYTILCLVIFCCFNLYSGIWKYAGFNDLNRIVGANVVCFIVHIIGTLILLRGTPLIRMPISFYCLSAFTQTCLITASRFSYRLLLMEKVRVANNGKGATINAMVIGAGGTGKIVLQELEREKTVRPVCALNYKEIGFGSLLDGVPVVNGVENLKGAIEKYRVNPGDIELEITESVLIDDFEQVVEKLHIIKDYGIKISLDDFGTGFSSLSYLKGLPIDTLKIDKSFIDTVIDDESTKVITESIVSMVKKLGYETVAEGVETEAQYEYLKQIECDNIQGFLLGRPMPENELVKLMKKKEA